MFHLVFIKVTNLIVSIRINNLCVRRNPFGDCLTSLLSEFLKKQENELENYKNNRYKIYGSK